MSDKSCETCAGKAKFNCGTRLCGTDLPAWRPKEDDSDLHLIEIMQQYLTPEQFKGFLHGGVIQYILFHNFEGQAERGLEKAILYLKWLIQAERGERIDSREGL